MPPISTDFDEPFRGSRRTGHGSRPGPSLAPRGSLYRAARAAFRSMAEPAEPADVKVKTEEAPAGYDGPGALNEPPPSVTEAAPPPPPPADETQAADEQTPQVAQQTPVAMTPEQAAAAYAAQPDVQAAYAAAAAAYAAQPPQHYPQPQEVNRRLGQWTREEEAYAEKVAELFKTGRVPNCPEGTTMRALLADLLNCAPMRVSKKFSGERAIGKCSYKRSSADLDEEEAELKPLEQAFHDSVRGMGHLKMSDLRVLRCRGAFTPSMRLVSISRGRGWFYIRF